MINVKRMGEFCEFVKQYVPIVIKYFPDGSSSKSCESSACGNPECSLSNNFRGNGKD
jgi:hypothetical protein